jgi:carboxyl-terminal processing protease
MRIPPHDTRRRLSIWLAALLWLAVPAFAAPAAASASLTCERIPRLLDVFLEKHISYDELSDQLSSRIQESYLRRLDPSKTLLLEPEAAVLRSEMNELIAQVKRGDCSKLEEHQKELSRHYREMEDFVRNFVSRSDYTLDSDVVLVIDPDKRSRPANVEERNELYTKLAHFHMSNYLSTGLSSEEAKKKLIHRYELATRRAMELNSEDIYAIFLDAFASTLDPHSHYLSAEVLEDFQIDMRLSLDGIGVALSSRDGYSIVERIIPGGATDRLNLLQPKDKIISVAQEDLQFVDVIDMDLRHVVRLIRGKRGTKVHLRVLRQGESTEQMTVTIVRDKIDLEERSAKLRIESVTRGDGTFKLGILELPSFYGDRNPTKRQSSRDLRNLLSEAKKEKVDGLLLDLSRNGGGLLETAVEIAGFFIRDGGIVAVKGTDSGVQVLRDSDENILYDGPLVLLTSRISASASEIVAGAMRDYQRAVVVGDDHTFGKGTVQSMVPLAPGLGALKVTTALFFRPGGESTQHLGVESHIILPSLSNTDDFGETNQLYSLPSRRIDPFLESRGAGKGEKRPWLKVTPKLITELSRRSIERVQASEAFAEIQRQLEEARQRDGVIHLADILKDSGSDEAAGDASVAATELAGDGDDQEPSPQQLEAIQILADYVALLEG